MCTTNPRQCSSAESDCTTAAAHALPRAGAAGAAPAGQQASVRFRPRPEPCGQTSPCDELPLPLVVPHIRQAFNWDCGLACVLMALRALGEAAHDMATLRALCATRSVWTVDLAHLLAACGADVAMLTVTVGANAAYAGERFYAETMREDVARVERLFQEAAAAGISVQQRSLSGAELAAVVAAGRQLVIALVDKRRLLADPGVAAAVGESPDAPAALSGGSAGGGGAPGSGYTGHYLLLCGFDPGRREYVARDPAAAVPGLRVPEGVLEAARKSWGTDEDLLLIEVAPLRQGPAAAVGAAAPAAAAAALAPGVAAIP